LAGIDSAQEAARHSRPTLLIHGAADQLFFPAASADFINVLEEAGRPFESVLVSRGDHAFADKACREAAIATIVDFFSRMIRAAEPALSSSDAS
jgi:dipeptidyl aminopeptidase/acylaminoacyl peptidase